MPTSFSEFLDKLETEGFEYISNYLDGTLGLSSLFNTWAKATASADKLAIAGSINVLVFTNVAESIVHSGAQINQDPFYRPDARFYLRPGDLGYDPVFDPTVDPDNYDPAEINDNVTHSDNSNNVDEHVVSIEAINYMQFMNMTGVFGVRLTPNLMPDFTAGLGCNGVVASGCGSAEYDTEYKGANSLTPASGKKGGVGGAIFLQFLDNTTRAIVEDDVDLYSGTQSGLNMKAEELIMNFAFSQAGASSGKVAVGGTFAYTQQDSETLAHLDAGSTIRGGRVDVYAGSLSTHINWAGGVAQSKAIGAGVAIAINNIKRDTRAVIGEQADTAGTTITGGSIVVAGTVTARAIVAGAIYAFTVAGAVANASGQKDNPSPTAGGNAPASNNPVPGVSAPALPGQTSPTQAQQDQQAGTSVAIAAAVAVNSVTDRTQASLADYTVTADALDVKATNANSIVAATGGLAFSKNDAGGNAVALAGAFSYNGIDATTDAWVRNATITLRDTDFEAIVVETTDRRFSVTADSIGNVWTLAAGGGGAVAGGGTSDNGSGSFALSLAGSVAVNTITGHTRARVIDTGVAMIAATDGTVSEALVRATDDADIFAIAGALSLAIAEGGKGKATAVAFGVAIAVNNIGIDTEALVETSDADLGRRTPPAG